MKDFAGQAENAAGRIALVREAPVLLYSLSRSPRASAGLELAQGRGMARLFSFLRGKKLLLGILVLLALTAVACWYLTPLRSWYYLRGLAAAGDEDRDVWVQRVASLDTEALPGLLALLGRDDPQSCFNAQAALSCLIQRWGNTDRRTLNLAEQLEQSFPSLKVPGQQSILELEAVLVTTGNNKPPPASSVIRAASRILLASAKFTDRSIRARTLALASVLVHPAQPAEVMKACRELARQGLLDPDADNRVRAIHLTLQPALLSDLDLAEQVVPLLKDPMPEVRRVAMLAVGNVRRNPEDPDSALVAIDDLLSWLHDPDADVRRLCEEVLRSRGLREGALRLGKMITDERPSVRMGVLDHLFDNADMTPSDWLRRLSHDPSPAVRAAAARVAGSQTLVDLSDRLRQMAQDDPSPTVQQLAAYYLQRYQAGKKGQR
jgi:HEAT repeat protein